MSEAQQPTIDTLWDFNDPAASEDRFRAAAELATGAQLAEIQTKIARAMGLQERFDDGHATLDAIAETGSRRVQVLIALERGRLFNSAGDRITATGHFHAAADLARHSGEPALEIDALHMLAIADVEHASQWNDLALGKARASDPPAVRRWLGSLLNNQGWTLFDEGDFHGALALFEEALAHFVERGDPEQIRIARWTVARCLRALGEHEAALVILGDLESNHPGADGFVAEEMAENLLATHREDESRAWFSRACAALERDSWLVANEPDRLTRLATLGRRE